MTLDMGVLVGLEIGIGRGKEEALEEGGEERWVGGVYDEEGW
jgi:hypothetical protein